MLRLSLVTILLAVPLVSQTTWVVDAAGGPGVHFLDLPTAVAAAATGDTIVVHTGPNQEGASSFTTDKGLTILGAGGQVPLDTSTAQPIVVTDLPAGATFRMAGFRSSNSLHGQVNVRVSDCTGAVHFETMHGFEPKWTPTPSFVIENSVAVTLRDVATFGYPYALEIDASRVLLVDCSLGWMQTHFIGGGSVQAVDSVVDIVRPRFWSYITGSMNLTTCQVRIAGDATSSIFGTGGSVVMPTIGTSGGTLTIDPQVLILGNPPPGGLIAGTAVVAFATVPASWPSTRAVPGATLSTTSTAEPGAFVFQAYGLSIPPVDLPLGTIGIDPNGLLLIAAPQLVPAGGSVVDVVSLAPVPAGFAFTTQSIVLDAAGITFGLPCALVAH